MTSTVSLDVAKRLKAAGLVWKPKRGDWYESPYTKIPKMVSSKHHLEVICKVQDSRYTWLPALSDILSRLEEMGYWWKTQFRLIDDGVRKYITEIDRMHRDGHYLAGADTPEDSAGLALIWALGQEGGQLDGGKKKEASGQK